MRLAFLYFCDNVISPIGAYFKEVNKEQKMDHLHSEESVKKVLNRISRATGHLSAIKGMVEDGRDCSDVLIQLSAIRSAVNKIGQIILEDHIRHCVTEAVTNNDHESLDKLGNAISKFLK